VIDTRTLQTFLKTEGYYTGSIDGIFGPMSYAAARAALKSANVNAGSWANDRVFIGLEQLFLNKVASAGLIVDGISGQHTNDAIFAYNSGQLHPTTKVWPRQSDVRAGTSMFGRAGRNQGEVVCPYLMYGDYDRRIKVSKFSAHTKVVASLERILQRTLDYYGPAQIRKLNLDIFSGCYNYRSTTGSSSLSMHAWGVAIDIDAAHNQMDESSSEGAAFSKPVYAPFLDFFEDEGWVNLGRARNYDFMHCQAARL
jgi:peptidoglycan hydrolase-like protein with peptidoglycan-binding domain